MNKVMLHDLADAQLVMRYLEQGSTDCVGELYDRYHLKLYKYCLRLCKNENEAYDITAEAFTKAVEKITALKDPALFAPWLFRIAHNDCMNFLQRNQNRFLLDISTQVDLAYEVFDEESALAREQLFDQMNDSLARLAPDIRQMMLDRYYRKKTILELQEEYGLTESAVKMRLARARRRIARLNAIWSTWA
ncbi:MAG: sigma-70 family RNA polymerase sigma factor [Sinomicrobium sp.]|nr:sigma-70 family RNA polymerase sigma factor [Sinomicrobium sp.]